jgi:hypothetical protein
MEDAFLVLPHSHKHNHTALLCLLVPARAITESLPKVLPISSFRPFPLRFLQPQDLVLPLVREFAGTIDEPPHSHRQSHKTLPALFFPAGLTAKSDPNLFPDRSMRLLALVLSF